MHLNRLLFALSLVLSTFGCGGGGDAVSGGNEHAIEKAIMAGAVNVSGDTSTTGTVSASGKSWVRHDFIVAAPGVVELSLNWPETTANLNLFLYGPDGRLLEFANSATARPEVLTSKLPSAGTYRVGIKAASGSASYTLHWAMTETTFTGNCSASGSSWVSHGFQAEAHEQLDATLSWPTASANLNLFLSSPNGTSLATANSTTTRPEVAQAITSTAGEHQASVKCKSGASTYTLVVRRSVNGSPPEAPPYPGQPQTGTLYWGAAVQGNSDPTARHETPAGAPLGVHRTFFQWDARVTKLVAMAAGDLASGRLPWVSVKPPSWTDMASGRHDQEIDELLTALDALGGPVWLTVHHEPEGGGGNNSPDDAAGPSGHVAMNVRVRARMTALKTKHIALAPILMTYTFQVASGRNPDEWFAPGIYDFIGVDHYRDAEATLVNQTWGTVRAWAAARGLDLAVGEWGMRGTDAAAGQRVQAWFDAAAASATDGGGARVVALSAFDSGLNAPSGSWALQGAQLSSFHVLMTNPRAAQLP